MYPSFNDQYLAETAPALYKNRARAEKYRKGKTLLSFFRYNVGLQCESIKYLNNSFLRAFIADYNETVKTGLPVYHRTQATDFYIKNGGAYCVFLEAWSSYKEGMKKLHGEEE